MLRCDLLLSQQSLVGGVFLNRLPYVCCVKPARFSSDHWILLMCMVVATVIRRHPGVVGSAHELDLARAGFESAVR